MFARELTDALTQQLAARVGANVLGEENLLTPGDLDDMRRELRAEPAVRALIERLWPVLTPQRLLADLFASADRLAAAAPRLTRAERAALLRSPDSDWTPADVPLLDEAAELLGEDDRAVRAAAERRRRAQVAYASGVLDIIARDMDDDPEILMGADLVDASRLATRHEDEERLTAAERAAGDRTWAFGHVIVDEAQELSEMAWRMLMRRCPGRSMTIVGDVAQTGSLAGASSWTERAGALPGRPVAADRADDQLPHPGGDHGRRGRRAGGHRPGPGPAALRARHGHRALAARRRARGPGQPAGRRRPARGRRARRREQLAVIVPAGRLDEFGSAIRAAVPGSAVGEHSDLEQRVVVLTVQQAKGLEFDTVLIGDPAGILAESPRGLNDLYVALTRATQAAGRGVLRRACRRSWPGSSRSATSR